MKKRLFHSAFTGADLPLLKVRKVKEGMFRLGISMMLSGLTLIALSPLPLIASPSEPLVLTTNKNEVWRTELVLADKSPDLLADKPVQIEKVASRYQEATTQKAVVAKVTKPKIAQTKPAAVQPAGSACVDVSHAEKMQWADKAAAAHGIPTELLKAVW